MLNRMIKASRASPLLGLLVVLGLACSGAVVVIKKAFFLCRISMVLLEECNICMSFSAFAVTGLLNTIIDAAPVGIHRYF